MKLYQWYDTLIVASDEADVRRLMKGNYILDSRTDF